LKITTDLIVIDYIIRCFRIGTSLCNPVAAFRRRNQRGTSEPEFLNF
jgi:hypothetical protein